jgi:DNA-binding response OmpR family regulator
MGKLHHSFILVGHNLSGSMRLLVVEDEHKLTAVLQRGLLEQGYAVDVAYTGTAGLAAALAAPYDAIVLDVMLPEIDGCALCRELRVQGQTVPVLMLTARDSVDDRVTGLDSGADDYLVKPFAFRELLARIRALLRRDSSSKDPILRASDVELDTARREVRRAGFPIGLTSKEFAILEYFMRNPNCVLTRRQIAEHVWDYDFEAMSNIVDVYIGYLRRKLADDRPPQLLRTVRGTGYQLRAP